MGRPTRLALAILGAVNGLAVLVVMWQPKQAALAGVLLAWAFVAVLTILLLRLGKTRKRVAPPPGRVGAEDRASEMGQGAIGSLLPGLAVLTLGLLSVVGWAILYQWYSLFDNFIPHFAIDKIPGHFESPILHHTAIIFIALTAIYGAGYLLIKKARTSRLVKAAIILTIVGCGLVNLFLYPITALDVFFYLAQIKLAYFYGQNPYLVTFDHAGDPFGYYAFHLRQPLGYPPGWLLLSALPAALSGLDDLLSAVLTYKAFTLVLIILTGFLVSRYQADEKSRWLAAYLFLANPLILFEGVANGHIDAVMTLFLIAAMLALSKRSALAAPLLTMSALIKFTGGILAPLFGLVMLRERWGVKRIALSIVTSLAVVVLAFAPFWAGGEMVGHMLRSVRYHGLALNVASVFTLVREYLRGQQVPESTISYVWYACAGLFVLLAGIVVWRQKHEFERAVANILLLFILLMTMFFPWYLFPVIAVLALKRQGVELDYLFLATGLGLLHYPLMVWAWSNSGLARFSIHLFEAMFITWPALAFLAVQAGLSHLD